MEWTVQKAMFDLISLNITMLASSLKPFVQSKNLKLMHDYTWERTWGRHQSRALMYVPLFPSPFVCCASPGALLIGTPKNYLNFA